MTGYLNLPGHDPAHRVTATASIPPVRGTNVELSVLLSCADGCDRRWIASDATVREYAAVGVV